MPKQDFLKWCAKEESDLDSVERKISQIKELLKSVPQMNYVGRIIMSVTDDTEQKVIQKYGGKRWRRIENFLRGVGEDDIEIGKKFGEEYVELRESNIPLHQHKV